MTELYRIGVLSFALTPVGGVFAVLAREPVQPRAVQAVVTALENRDTGQIGLTAEINHIFAERGIADRRSIMGRKLLGGDDIVDIFRRELVFRLGKDVERIESMADRNAAADAVESMSVMDAGTDIRQTPCRSKTAAKKNRSPMGFAGQSVLNVCFSCFSCSR